jgi:hypothetical protein
MLVNFLRGFTFITITLATLSVSWGRDYRPQQRNNVNHDEGRHPRDTQIRTRQDPLKGQQPSQSTIQYDQRRFQEETARREQEAQERARQQAQRQRLQQRSWGERFHAEHQGLSFQPDQRSREKQYAGPQTSEISRTLAGTDASRRFSDAANIELLQRDQTLFRSGYFRRTPSGIVDSRTGKIVAPPVQTIVSSPAQTASLPTQSQNVQLTPAPNLTPITPTAAKTQSSQPTQIQGSQITVASNEIPQNKPLSSTPIPTWTTAQSGATSSTSNQPKPTQPTLSTTDAADIQRLQTNTSIAVSGNYGRTPGGIVDLRSGQIVASSPQTAAPATPQVAAQAIQTRSTQLVPASNQVSQSPTPKPSPAPTTPSATQTASMNGLATQPAAQPAQPTISASDAADIQRLQKDTSIAMAGNYGRIPNGIVDLRTGQIVASAPQIAAPPSAQTSTQQNIPSNPASGSLLTGRLLSTTNALSTPPTIGISPTQGISTPSTPPQSTLGKSGGIPTTVHDAIKLTNSSPTPASVYHSDGYIYRPTQTALQHECVALVVALRPDVGTTTKEWSKGTDITKTNGNYPSLQAGTPIATFKNGSYPSDGIMNNSVAGNGQFAHSAIFLGYTYDINSNITGMKILEQYVGQPSKIGERAFPTRYTYSVIN